MKRLFILLLFFFTIIATPSVVSAEGMPAPSAVEGMGGWTSSPSKTDSDNHTAREEAEGKDIWEKLQAKQITCRELTDDNFGALGEYFMGQMAGEQHEAMNNMMIQMMGEEGEKQMHVAMGKRMSGCEPNAPMPQNMPALSGVEGMNSVMMPMMMNMMMGSASSRWPSGFGSTKGGGNPMPALSGVEGMGNGWGNMMGGWGGFGLGWVFMILFWGLLILAIIALLKWLLSGSKGQSDKTPLEILQERFAKGEIDKKEYEEKAKILSKHV